MDDAADSLRIEALLAEERWVRKLARSLCADSGAADDLVQDAWVAALEHPPRESERLRAWLRTVLTNLALAGRRSGGARAQRERVVARAEAQEDVTSVVERAERSRWLAAHTLALAEPYRSTVLWRYFDGLSAEAIARREGVTASTVRTRLERGLAQLRARLERERGKHWSLVLLPLVELPMAATSAGASAALLGSIGMTTANKVVLALAGVFGILWFAVPRDEAPVSPAHARDAAVMPAPLADAKGPNHGAAGVDEPTAARDVLGTEPPEPVSVVTTPAKFNYRDLVTSVPGGRIEGIVLRETEPVDGGHVSFWRGHWRPLPLTNTLADEEAPERVPIRRDGRFTIPDLEADWYSLAVDVGSGVSAQVNARVQDPSTSLVIVLGTARIEGTVYDEDGARVAGAAVSISHDAWDGSTPSTHYTHTGRDGTYRVADLPSGSCWFTVDFEGELGAGAQDESMRKLDPLAVGEVRVVDHGSPLGTVRWSGRLLARSGAAVPGPGTLGVSNDATDAYEEAAMVADGSFELRLRPGSYTVWSKRGERNVDLGTHLVGAADFEQDLVLPGTTILGRARYEGAPRSDLRISLHYSDGRPAHEADVEPDGTFRFDGVSAGQWTVRAYPLRIHRGEPTVTVLDNDVELPLEVQLELP